MEVKKDRQAVVIIHGMGEQRPMDTLRSFVKNVKSQLEKNDPSEKTKKIRSQPDPISGTYETRRLSLNASHYRPITDFYEFYWAHNMRNTSLANISGWLRRLLTTLPSKIPPRLKGLWYTVYGLFLVAFALTALLLILVGVENFKALVGAILAIPFVFTIISLAEKYFTNLFFSTLGDAARYFNPIPSNIEERHNIRHQGISFLQKLHKTIKEESYDRIIIVAHSLGSSIGYDLLKFLWIEYNATFDENEKVDQCLLKEMDNFCKNPEAIGNVDEFQDLQYRFWLQQKGTGNKWLITDFITLGAAVTSIDYFSPSSEPFKEMVEQREFPVCPPVTDKGKSISYESKTYEVGSVKRTVKVLHHAALFAITRWTNIYFRSDFVGGDAARIFGKGVKDVPIPRKSLWFLPGGHTKYWNDATDNTGLKEIISALRLRRDENPKLETPDSEM